MNGTEEEREDLDGDVDRSKLEKEKKEKLLELLGYNRKYILPSTILSFKEIEKESRPNFRETDARPLLPVDKYRSIFKYLRCYAIFPRIGYSIRDMARFPPTVSMRIYRPKYDFMKINAAFVGRIDK